PPARRLEMPDERIRGEFERISAAGRRAVELRDWAAVGRCAGELLRRDGTNPEGYFLSGLQEKAAQRPIKAAEAFAKALELDPGRYDAAIELADQHSVGRRNAAAAAMLARYEVMLKNSPRYLDMAGTVYSHIGMPERAWPLYQRANELQPGIPLFQANLAACGVYLGKIAEAKAAYRALLERVPTHQRNHYQLARLEQAKDNAHVEQMKAVLQSTRLPPDKNIFLYYAIGKELEDLGQWEEAFRYYQMAGDAVTSVAHYDVATDIALIDKIIEVCDADWLAAGPERAPTEVTGKTPIFIVGLPRTGTTLTERIVASHSHVESIGETQFMQMMLRSVSGVESVESMNPAMIEAVAQKDIGRIANGYLNAVNYRLGDTPFFIDKLPFNFLYLAFVAKAYPDAGLIYLRRNPMDTCFAMYKQVFTWAYKFSYSLEGLGRYYVAHDRLLRHWRGVLGERLIEIQYESLVADQEGETRRLLSRLGLEFEPACLEFEKNESASATASSVQIREKIHARSVNRWRHFETQLRPLQSHLENAGILVD
ncbi:MAG: sulfotransferase, partial [Steroidobacteraceae bacterium]